MHFVQYDTGTSNGTSVCTSGSTAIPIPRRIGSTGHSYPSHDSDVNATFKREQTSAELSGLPKKTEMSTPSPVKAIRKPTLEDMFELEPSSSQKPTSHNLQLRYPSPTKDPRLAIQRSLATHESSTEQESVRATASGRVSERSPSPAPYEEECGTSEASRSQLVTPEIDWDKEITPAAGHEYRASADYEIDWNCSPYEWAIRYKGQPPPDSPSPEPSDSSSSAADSNTCHTSYTGSAVDSLNCAREVKHKSHSQSIRRFLEKCGLDRRHCETYSVHFDDMGISTLQDLDTLINFKLEDQLLHTLKKSCGARWLQLNLIKNGLEKNRKRLQNCTIIRTSNLYA